MQISGNENDHRHHNRTLCTEKLAITDQRSHIHIRNSHEEKRLVIII